MPKKPTILTGIPESEVDKVVERYKKEGAIVEKKKESDGSYTVTAHPPDSDAGGKQTSSASSSPDNKKPATGASPGKPTSTSAGSGSTPTGSANQPATGNKILRGDGTWPWFAEIDGKDIIVRDAIATAFGGDEDPMDSGDTASGCRTKGNPALMGCALPMDGYGVAALKGSPLPKIPFGMNRDCSDNAGGAHVIVTHRASGKNITVPAIDLGPGKRTGHALDLTVAAAKKFDSSATANNFEMKLDYRIIDGAKFVT